MKDKTVNIQGVRCSLIKFSPSEGLPILARMQNMLGGSIAELAGAKGGTKGDIMSAVASAVDKMADRNPPEKLTEFITDVLTSGNVVMNGEKVTHLDDLGTNDEVDAYFLMMCLLKEQLVFSFAGFLGRLVEDLDGLLPEPAKL